MGEILCRSYGGSNTTWLPSPSTRDVYKVVNGSNFAATLFVRRTSNADGNYYCTDNTGLRHSINLYLSNIILLCK